MTCFFLVSSWKADISVASREPDVGAKPCPLFEPDDIVPFSLEFQVVTNSKGTIQKGPLPETNMTSHPKMDAWNTIVSFWGPAYFQVRSHVRFRECIIVDKSVLNL